MIGTDEQGVCVLENRPAVAYRVRLYRLSSDANSNTTHERTPALEFDVLLRIGGTATVVSLPR